MGKKLVRNTIVNGTVYGPDGEDPTAEVLEQITNDKVFEEADTVGILDGVDTSVVELKGKALDAALDEAGLSKDGTVAEKRERLAEHQKAGAGS